LFGIYARLTPNVSNPQILELVKRPSRTSGLITMATKDRAVYHYLDIGRLGRGEVVK
jgi:hypothetical protein